MKTGNIVTLHDDPIPQHLIPKYPTFKLIKAHGGETTFDIDPKIKFGDGQSVIPFQRKAKPGEILRNQSLELIADTRENRLYRGKVKQLCREKPHNIKLELKRCASDIRYFANVYCWTFVPGKAPIPFILYKFQEDLLTWVLWLVKNHLTGLIDKSRKMGLSWLTQIITAYMCLLFDYQIVYHLSMTEKEVDNRTQDSLLGKFRILMKELPVWMQGGWSERGKDEVGEVVDKKMQILIPDTNSRIEGELTGGEAGRGGRSNFNIYDEFPHVKDAKETLDAAVSLVDSKLFLGTVKGMNNEFAKMRWRPGALVKSYHWTLHPLKDEKWSILERADSIYDDERWAQEMDMDYRTSTSGRVYPRFISKINPKKRIWVHVKEDEKYFKYDPNYDVYAGLDFGISDPNTIVFMQLKPMLPTWPNPLGNIMVFFDEFMMRNQEDWELADYLTSKNYRYKIIYGDERSLSRRNSDGHTLRANVKKRSGIYIFGRRNSAMAPIKAVKHRIALPGAMAVDKDGCPQFIESIQHWAYKIDKESKLPLSNQDPQHNQSFYSHYNKACAYLIDNIEGGPIGAMDFEDEDLDEDDWDYDECSVRSI